ncbi:MAG: hypothetical protein AB7F50_07330 [Fimbriimonadaceae bacterium]
MSKPELSAMLTTFAAVAAANAGALSLDPAEITAINTQKTDLTNSLNDQLTAQAAASGAVAACSQELEDAVALLSRYNAEFKANPAVSDELIAQLGLPPRSQGGGSIPVYVPINLAALGCSNGVNSLRWKSNGNASGTTYIIECAYDGTQDFDMIDAVTVLKYDHEDQVPGRQAEYRVIAKRTAERSAPSNTAIVYSGGGGEQLTLEAA